MCGTVNNNIVFLRRFFYEKQRCKELCQGKGHSLMADRRGVTH